MKNIIKILVQLKSNCIRQKKTWKQFYLENDCLPVRGRRDTIPLIALAESSFDLTQYALGI